MRGWLSKDKSFQILDRLLHNDIFNFCDKMLQIWGRFYSYGYKTKDQNNSCKYFNLHWASTTQMLHVYALPETIKSTFVHDIVSKGTAYHILKFNFIFGRVFNFLCLEI